MIKIISDSTSDLSQDLIKKYDISILPLHVMLGEKDYHDGVDIKPEELYTWSEANKSTPKTAAPSPDEAVQLMRPILEAGHEIICFSISGSMSSSWNVMRLASEELEASNRVWVFDSQNLSTGIGLLIVEAAVMAEKGMKAQEIVKELERLCPLVRASFVVDTLTYLYRGGRCSGLAAMAGGVLRLHPKIVVNQGKMEPTKKYRGKLIKVVKDYVMDMEPSLKQAKKDRVFITHSGCEQEIIEEVYTYLCSLHRFDEILITRAGSVISSHCGPGTLGVLFIAGDGEVC